MHVVVLSSGATVNLCEFVFINSAAVSTLDVRWSLSFRLSLSPSNTFVATSEEGVDFN